jgi:hypothetical protein
MTISELIERLEALKAEHGDLPVNTCDNLDETTAYVGLQSELDPHWGVQIAVGKC